MKFCKNLQRVAELSNPEWNPFWTDYKQLKVRRKKEKKKNIKSRRRYFELHLTKENFLI
jgi:hypothetical protein